MSQHDFDIANQTAASARSDINNALQALASLSSGDTAPSTTYANMLWYETDTNILKMRNEADSAWINVGYLDQGSSAFRILDDTQVMNTGGTQTGLLGDQATATWEAGSGTTESLVSPAKVKAAITSIAGVTWVSPVATTSGTSVDFSSIPSGVTTIYVGFNEVSLSGSTNNLLVQLGDSGGVETTGYVSSGEWSGNAVQSTSGFIIRVLSSGRNVSGVLLFTRMDASANTWVTSGSLAVGTAISTVGGVKSLSSELTSVRLTTTGAETLDNGSLAIGYIK
jgi:hypothetical protein